MLLVLVLGLLTARALRDGEAELERSTQAFNQGDLRGAVLHARRSAVAYVPGAPHVEAAYARLRAIAEGAEARGDADTARLAWGAVRTAALESRHLWVTRGDELATANRQLERLQAEKPSGAKPPRRRSHSVPEHPGPRPGWSVALALGFLLALAGLGWFGFYAVRPDGSLNRQRAWVGLLLGVLGAACWTLSLYWA
jgi:hypothetical protein